MGVVVGGGVGLPVGALEGSVTLVGAAVFLGAVVFGLGFLVVVFFFVVVAAAVSVVVVVLSVVAMVVDGTVASVVAAAEDAGGVAGLLQAVSETASSAARKPAAAFFLFICVTHPFKSGLCPVLMRRDKKPQISLFIQRLV